jgi:class 3 adenylate cyclase/pimeloyl-ACP methyl ester carboxylesterase
MSADERRLVAILFTDIVGYTALVGEDEAQGIAARERHRGLVESLSAQFRGEFVDESGDASLCIFASAVDAVRCGLAIQAVLAGDPGLQVRIGIHVGDVVERDGRLIGDGINLASRLPALAEPGGICATDRVVEHLRNQNVATAALGAKQLKNVARPVPVYAVAPAAGARRRSRRSVALAGGGLLLALGAAYLFWAGGVEDLMMAGLRRGLIRPGEAYAQEIAFTTASDGVRIAWSSAGADAAPVVMVLGWFTHLERGANSPGFNPWTPPLLPKHRVVQYDGRGSGLSDRGVSDYSLEAKLRDLEAVAAAAGLDRFGLYAISAGGSTAIAYAARHPERVTRLAFYGSFAAMDETPENLQRWRSLPPLVRASWGDDNPAYRQLFTSLFMPEADEISVRTFNEFQRISATPDDAAAFIEAMIEIDARELAPRVRAPTLVVHVRGDRAVPFSLGREIASLVPGARLVGLEGSNHVMGIRDTGWNELQDVMASFFEADLAIAGQAGPPEGGSSR